MMARDRFRATHGSDCVFDAVGRDVRRRDRLVHHAAEVAERVMGSLEGQEDGAQRRVGVHDSGGRRVPVQASVLRTDTVARAA